MWCILNRYGWKGISARALVLLICHNISPFRQNERPFQKESLDGCWTRLKLDWDDFLNGMCSKARGQRNNGRHVAKFIRNSGTWKILVCMQWAIIGCPWIIEIEKLRIGEFGPFTLEGSNRKKTGENVNPASKLGSLGLSLFCEEALKGGERRGCE